MAQLSQIWKTMYCVKILLSIKHSSLRPAVPETYTKFWINMEVVKPNLANVNI